MRPKVRAVIAVTSVVAVACLLVVMLTSGAAGQDQQKPQAPPMMQPPGPPGGMPPMGMMPGMMRPMMPPTPAIAVANGKVFVVLGGTIYKLDAETLELEGQNDFVQPRVPPGAMPGAGMPVQK